MKPEESTRLNNELLKAEEPPVEDDEKRPKRNSKEELTAKILKVSQFFRRLIKAVMILQIGTNILTDHLERAPAAFKLQRSFFSSQ